LEDKHRVVKQLEEGHHVPYTTREVGQYLVVEASTGIIVIWDKKTTIFVKLAPSYKVGCTPSTCQPSPGLAPSTCPPGLSQVHVG
jgi:hypothetical protein